MEKQTVKIALILLCLLCLVVPLHAQNQTVKLPAKEMTVRQAISELGKQTGKYFGFSSTLDLSRTIRVEQTEVSFQEFFDIILGTDFTFTEDGDYILIYHKSLEDVPPTGFISGRIVDAETGEPIGEAMIGIPAENIRLRTNASGYFQSKELPEGSYVVTFGSPDERMIVYREIATTETPQFRTVIRMKDFSADDRKPERKPLLTIQPVEQTFRKYAQNPGGKPLSVVSSEPSAGYRDFSSVQSDYRPGIPQMALKTNALWWGLGALNAEGEIRLARKWTADLSFAYSPWESGEKKRRFWIIQPEARYWLCNAFEKHSVGVHAIYGKYKIGHLNLPFPTLLEDDYLDGALFGAGISYGYHMPLGKRWGMELSLGLGFLNLKYDQYSEGLDAGITKTDSRYYFGPTKVGISVFYIIR